MFKVLSRVLFNSIAAMSCVLFANGNLHAQQWENVGNTQPVSAGGTSYTNLVIDYVGNYYISYYDVSAGKGSVQKFDGTSWSYVGGSAGITSGIATFNSLSADHSGNLYYTNQIGWPGTGMEVRKFSGSSWNQLPDAASVSLNYHASAVAPSGFLFTFSGENSGTVKRFVNGAWEQVGNSGFSSGASYAEMVIGSNNKVYTCNVSGGVQVYENSATAGASDNWSLVGGSIVDASSSSEQYNSDIAIDAANNLYVAYVSSSANGRKLNVKKFNGTSWVQLGAPNFSDGRVQHIAVAVSASGQPYVVASRWENDNYSRNSVYKFDLSTQTWAPLGGDFISDGQATFNDLAFDNVHNNLVLIYSQGGVRVKKISQGSAGLVCNNTDPGTGTGSTGCVNFTYRGQNVTYTTVRGADGKIWLQQNLGSTKVASSLSDADAYGDLFQWGRWDDGHQLRNSVLNAVSPAQNNPGGLNGGSTSFYSAAYNSSSNWWADGVSTDKWDAPNVSQVSAVNGADPCKAIGTGWRMPAKTEVEAAITAENITELNSALSSNLKLVPAGIKDYNGIFSPGTRLYLWTSTPSAYTGSGEHLYISQFSSLTNSGGRDGGQSVRCIKTEASGLGTSDIRKASIGIYPNPTSGILNIKAGSAVEKVRVYTVSGQVMNVNFSQQHIDLTSLPRGIYIIEVTLKNGQKVSEKIIKN